MDTLSTCILNFNGKDYLEKCLKSVPLSIAGIRLEKILIDNASTDESWKIADKYGFSVVHADNKHKFITGLNKAIESSHGRYFLFSQADLWFKQDAIRNLIKSTLLIKRGVVQPVIYSENGAIDNAGMNWIWPGYGIRRLKKTNGFLYETDIATTITFMTTRNVLDKVGPFDTELSPAYYEDVDYALRCRGFGLRHYICSKASVVHNHTTSFSKLYSKKDLSNICFKNRLYVVKKHYKGFDRCLRCKVIRVAQSLRTLKVFEGSNP